MVKVYLLNLFIWLDIGFNVIFLSGSPYETISSRVGKQAQQNKKWACVFCKMLDKLLGPQHCQASKVPDYDKSLQWWKKIW